MPLQLVKKAQRAFLTRGLNDGRSAAPVMRGVISDVHAAGNDRFDFFPPFAAEILRSFFAVNKFFDRLRHKRVLCLLFSYQG